MPILPQQYSTLNIQETNPKDNPRTRILEAAQRLFARKGYDKTTTKDLAFAAKVAEGTIFRHFSNKKAILVELATNGWVEILTDLLTELSEMASYKAIAQVMRRRLLRLDENADLLKVCFIQAQFHPELRDRIQIEVIEKMTSVAEAFFETAIEKGIYRPINPKIIARIFLGMFAIASFSHETLFDSQDSKNSPSPQKMAEGIADIFLNGVLVKEA